MTGMIFLALACYFQYIAQLQSSLISLFPFKFLFVHIYFSDFNLHMWLPSFNLSEFPAALNFFWNGYIWTNVRQFNRIIARNAWEYFYRATTLGIIIFFQLADYTHNSNDCNSKIIHFETSNLKWILTLLKMIRSITFFT